MDLLENNAMQCPQDVPLLGLDVGHKTIGLAISDSAHRIAMPLQTLKRTKFSKDLLALEDVILEHEVGGYVLGYPLHMDGREGRKCQSIKDFAHEFRSQLAPGLIYGDTPWITFWDERLSTSSVNDFVDNTVDITRRKAKDKGVVDKLAAQHILQGALDYMQRL